MPWTSASSEGIAKKCEALSHAEFLLHVRMYSFVAPGEFIRALCENVLKNRPTLQME